MEGVESLLQLLGTQHEDQFDLMFIDETWLKFYPLTLETLPAYFYMSTFYDRTANNEKTIEDLSKLKQMKGLEYVFEQPTSGVDIFHVRKQYRHNEKKTTDLALYYVHQGRIYQAPTLFAVLQTKLQNVSGELQSSISALAKCIAVTIDKREEWL